METLSMNGSLITRELRAACGFNGKENCRCDCSPEESFQKIYNHLRKILPEATEKQILKLIG